MAAIEKTKAQIVTEDLVERIRNEIDKHGISAPDIISVNIIGSSLWGTRTDKSDYDIFVLHSSKSQKLSGKIAVGGAQFDFVLCHWDEFQDRMGKHELASYLIKYHPSHLTICLNQIDQKNRAMLDALFENHSFSKSSLLNAVLKQVAQDYERFLKLLAKAEITHACKVIVHALRSLQLSIQLIEHDKIVDWECANNYQVELSQLSCDDLAGYDNFIKPIFNELKYKLIDLATAKQSNLSASQDLSKSSGTKCVHVLGGGSQESPETIQFTKYEKMNTSSNKIKGGVRKGDYVVTEKVHGANFSMIVKNEDGPVYFARRTGVIGKDENFYGFRTNQIPEQYTPKACELFKMVTAYVQKENKTKSWGTEERVIDQIQIIGELFGGYFPGAPLNPIGPVQTGIWYTEKIEFMVFDIAISFKNPGVSESAAADSDAVTVSRREYLHFQETKQFSEQCGFRFVPILFVGKYEQALAYPIRFSSKVPSLLGVPITPSATAELGANFAEGVVIKCCKENHDSGYQSRVIFKQKIEEFSEKKYSTSRKEFTLRNNGNESQPAETDELNQCELLKYELFACLTHNRLEAVQSKIGIIDWKDTKQCASFLRSFVQDVLEDLSGEDRMIFEGLLPEIKKRLMQDVRDEAKLLITQWVAKS